jgi:hypothetical protein
VTTSGHWLGRSVGLVLIAAAAAGCGGSSSGSPGTGLGSTPTTATEFCDAVSNVTAAANIRCFGGTTADWVGGDYCANLGKRTTIQYHADLAKDCLAKYTAMTSTMCSLTDLECYGQVLEGLVADGHPCTDSLDCASGGFCLIGDGTACNLSMCGSQAPIGSPCGTSGCQFGAVCDANDMCVAAVQGDVGAACDGATDQLCRDGLSCLVDPNSGGSAGVCQRLGEGQPCFQDFDCPLNDFCDTTCKPRIAVGQPCTDHPAGCLLLAACDPVTNRCKAAGHLGQPCGSFGLCSGSFCDRTDPNPVCTAHKDLGAACVSGDECKSGVCHDNVCTDCPS